MKMNNNDSKNANQYNNINYAKLDPVISLSSVDIQNRVGVV